MANITFTPGSSTPFNPGSDTLVFPDSGSNAASLQFLQLGPDLRVGINGQYFTLLNVTFLQLLASSIVFANGSVFGKDRAVTTLCPVPPARAMTIWIFPPVGATAPAAVTALM